MAKVLESIVHRQLRKHVYDERLLSDAQHGCRRHHSKETALITVSDRILSAMDCGDVCVLCHFNLDPSEVQLPKLFAKLDKIGVDTSWLSSYLGGEAELVRHPINGMRVFEKTPHKMGVSLKSPLWSLLCCIFSDEFSELCGKVSTPKKITSEVSRGVITP